jgi:hypothetical protein
MRWHWRFCSATGYALTLVARKNGAEVVKKVELGGSSVATWLNRFSSPRRSLAGSDVIASGDKNANLWDGRVEVATVSACRHRPIHVRHENKAVLLSAEGTPSAALVGTTLGGAWELRSPLTLEEQQTPALRPKTLQILATVRCREEKP